MEVKLVVVVGKASKRAVTLKPPIVIGRSRQAELTVAHPMVSRRHCEIFEVDGLLMIRDLESLNGTVVEGRRIKLSPLIPGSEFTLGPLTFRAEYEYDGDLDLLPSTDFADRDAPPPNVGSDEEMPDSAAVDETPHVPFVDAPASGQASDSSAWEQTSTREVDKPDEEEAVIDIEELSEAKGEEVEDPEPTPPIPPRPKQPSVADAPKPSPARDDELDDFLKGLP